MSTYGDVWLGVESAWPVFVRRQQAGNRRIKIIAVVGVALAVAGLAVLTGRRPVQSSGCG